MEAERMSFAEYLEEVEGVTWAYFDNNFDAERADKAWKEYQAYLVHGQAYLEGRVENGKTEAL